jgi:hypothetical protein
MSNLELGLQMQDNGKSIGIVLRLTQSNGVIQNIFMTYSLESLWRVIRSLTMLNYPALT